MMFKTLIMKFVLVIIILSAISCQKKSFSVEVYPSEIDEDSSIVAGDELYRANLRGLWNNVNPYYGYTNNPYMMPPYMPMYGNQQPVMGGNYMGMAGQKSYNSPNPANFNYPKLMHVRGNQYQNYPKFKENQDNQENKKIYTEKSESANLAKELEKQIKELQKLTKEAKDLAKKKASEDKNYNKNNLMIKNGNNLQNSRQTQLAKQFKKSNLEQLSLDPEQKSQFDEGMKKIIDKLDTIN